MSIKNITNEEPFMINNNEFKKITFNTGEQIYKGLDKEFNALVTLKFKSTDDKETVEQIKKLASLLL